MTYFLLLLLLLNPFLYAEAKSNQTIKLLVARSIAVGTTGNISAKVSSRLVVSFSSITPDICSVTDHTVNGISVGNCIIEAAQGGDSNYNSAASKKTIRIKKGNQRISFGTAPTLAVGQTGSISVAATSGLSVALASKTPKTCTVSVAAISAVNEGVCALAASQAGDSNYKAAPRAKLSFNVLKAQSLPTKQTQTTSFSTPPNMIVGDNGNLSATASSGLDVSLISNTPNICTLEGNSIKGIAVDLCTIIANQTGNASYAPAPQNTLSFNISDKHNQTITFAETPTINIGQTTQITATASSGLPVEINTASPKICDIKNNTVLTGIEEGICILTANQKGNDRFNPAAQSKQFSFVVFTTKPMIASDRGLTVLLKEDGTVMTWPNIFYKKVGDVYQEDRNARIITPLAVSGLDHIVAVDKVGGRFFAVKTDGTVWTWGFSGITQTEPFLLSSYDPEPVKLSGFSDVVSLSLYMNNGLALKRDGSVISWGDNDEGQLCTGDYDKNNMGTLHPPAVIPGLSGIISISTTSNKSFLVKEDGNVLFCKPQQIYNGPYKEATLVYRSLVPGLTGVVKLSIKRGRGLSEEEESLIALKHDGTVMTFGDNFYGQSGVGDKVVHREPIKVIGLSDVVDVATSGFTSMAVKADGTVLTWGANGNGEIGNGTFTKFTSNEYANRDATITTSPLQVSGLSGVVAATMVEGNAIVLNTNGKIMAWGRIGISEQGVLGLDQTLVPPDFQLPKSINVPIEVGNYDFGKDLIKKPSSSGQSGCSSIYNPLCWGLGGGPGGGTGGGTGGAAACANAYNGPNNDPQLDPFCKQAALDACLHRVTGSTAYDAEGRSTCNLLKSFLSGIGATNTYSCGYCPYPY